MTPRRGGGVPHFSSYVGSVPASTVHPPPPTHTKKKKEKKISGISSTPKIFAIIAIQKNIPRSVP